MPYIPKKHKKYNLLPLSRKNEWEVFSYPVELQNEIDGFLPDGLSVIPYGYTSYQALSDELDLLIKKYGFKDNKINNIGSNIIQYKNEIVQRNIKENWSVVQFVGTPKDNIDLTKYQYYYWPCSIEEPVFEGVIDDEEFTSYIYPINRSDWLIAEDPLKVAASVLKLK